MKLIHPTQPIQIGQPFGGNETSVYGEQGLKGHTGIDFSGNYGQTIFCATDCYVYSDMNFGQSPDRYRAVMTLVDDGDFTYEVSYGHIIDSTIPIKTNLKSGEAIARMGNFGIVYAGSHLVTNEEKLAGSTAGTHLHFQVRKCIKVLNRSNGKQYIKDGNGYVKLNNMFIEVVDYDNGYNGCVDPQPFFENQPSTHHVFNTDMKLGDRNSEITELQKVLKKLYPPQLVTGYFYTQTLANVKDFQLKNNIPQTGYVGILTRTALNKLG